MIPPSSRDTYPCGYFFVFRFLAKDRCHPKKKKSEFILLFALSQTKKYRENVRTRRNKYCTRSMKSLALFLMPTHIEHLFSGTFLGFF